MNYKIPQTDPRVLESRKLLGFDEFNCECGKSFLSINALRSHKLMSKKHNPHRIKISKKSNGRQCIRCKEFGKRMTIVRNFCDECYFNDDSLQTSCAF